MRLFLSSDHLGDHVDRLLAAAGGPGARLALVTNALDAIPLHAQLDYARTRFDTVDHFSQRGFDPSPLDLRFYFGRPQALRDALLRHRVIWAVGGNAFLLRRAMHESGFENLLHDVLEEGVIYGGWSAGACVAGDSLRAIGLMDDPDATAPGYAPSEPIWNGLGLVPFTIIPHFRSDHPETESAEKAVAWVKEHGVEHRALRDGDVIIKTDGGLETLCRTP